MTVTTNFSFKARVPYADNVTATVTCKSERRNRSVNGMTRNVQGYVAKLVIDNKVAWSVTRPIDIDDGTVLRAAAGSRDHQQAVLSQLIIETKLGALEGATVIEEEN